MEATMCSFAGVDFPVHEHRVIPPVGKCGRTIKTTSYCTADRLEWWGTMRPIIEDGREALLMVPSIGDIVASGISCEEIVSRNVPGGLVVSVEFRESTEIVAQYRWVEGRPALKEYLFNGPAGCLILGCIGDGSDAGQLSPDSAVPMPPAVPTHPEPSMFATATGGLLEALCLVVGVARRAGEADASWRQRGAIAASRKIVDAVIAEDSGPFKEARAAALRSWPEEYQTQSVIEVRGVLAVFRGYERERGGARMPSAWAQQQHQHNPRAYAAYERARSL